MKCANHPETEAVDICPVCRRPICPDCAVNLAGKNYCRPCLEKKVAHLSHRPGAKSRFWAFMLSLVPGGGYFYLGLMKRGLQTMVVFFGAIFISAMTHIEPLAAFVVPIMVFYSIFDTQQLLSRMNEGQAVEDKELFDWGRWENKRGLIGGALILLGLLALLENLMPFYINLYAVQRFIPSLVIIGIGAYILYRNTARKGGDAGGNGKQDD